MSAILENSGEAAQRGGASFTTRNRAIRLMWSLAWMLLASWTPRQCQPWRRWLLIRFGATMGLKADVRASATIWYPAHLVMGHGAVIGPDVNCYNQALITLGDDALVSQGAHLCAGTHDVDDPGFQLIAKPIHIGSGAWIAAEAFLGPGTIVGDRAVVGARAVAFGHLDADMIYGGNPAKPLRKRQLPSSA